MKNCDGCRMPIRFWQSEVGDNHWYCALTRMNMLDRLCSSEALMKSTREMLPADGTDEFIEDEERGL